MRRAATALILALLSVVLAGAQPALASSFGFLAKWGSFGTGDGQFADPFGVATDSAGNVYVADTSNDPNDRIQKFSSGGTFITKWGSPGTGDGQFRGPYGVATDSAGNVYVADTYNERIQKFSSGGSFITKWGNFGPGDGQFRGPYGVATDSAGNVYVADIYNYRIQKFSSGGSFITKWGSFGQFAEPSGVATDSAGNVYVADFYNSRIQKFSSGGTFITKWGSFGTGDGQFRGPYGVATDSAGNVYVADLYNYRIQKFGEAVEPPKVSYDNLDAAEGVEIDDLQPTIRRTDTPTFSASPPLPEGLELDRQTGVITGTPSDVQDETTYTITVTGSEGTEMVPLRIRVDEDVPQISKSRSCRPAPGNSNATPNIWIRGIEINQGISGQKMRSLAARASSPTTIGYGDTTVSASSVDSSSKLGDYASTQLVAGKPAMARVYGATRGARSSVPATVQLHGWNSDGTALPGSPLSPRRSYRAPTSKTSTKTIRAKLACSSNFMLPQTWLGGSINIKAMIVSRTNAFQEPPGFNDGANSLEVDGLDFGPSEDVPLGGVQVRWPPRDRRGLTLPSVMADQAKTVDEAYPVARSHFRFATNYQLVADIDPPPSCNQMLQDFHDWITNHIKPPPAGTPFGKYVGFMPPYANLSCRGVADSPSGTAAISAPEWPTLAQEVAHDFGLRHASLAHGEQCDADQFGLQCNPNWPDGLNRDDATSGGHGHGSINGYGLKNLGLAFDRNDPSKASPIVRGSNHSDKPYEDTPTLSNSHNHDFMSYGCFDDGSNCWVSPNTWNALYDDLPLNATGPPQDLLPAASRGSRSAQSRSLRGGAPDHTRVLNTGSLLPPLGPRDRIELSPFTLVDGPPDPPKGDGTYKLVGYDAVGNVVMEQPFVPTGTSLGGLFFGSRFALPDSAVRVDLVVAGAVLASRTASAHAPTISDVGPPAGSHWRRNHKYRVSWNASDADGDRLEFICQYRNNPRYGYGPGFDGIWPNQSSLEDANAYVPGLKAQFRCKVSDGFHTAIAEGSTFRVDPKPLHPELFQTSADVDSAGGISLGAYLQDTNTPGREVRKYRWYHAGKLISRRNKFTTFRFRKRIRYHRVRFKLVATGKYGTHAHKTVVAKPLPPGF